MAMLNNQMVNRCNNLKPQVNHGFSGLFHMRESTRDDRDGVDELWVALMCISI